VASGSSPRASSSQPTGLPDRRLPSSAPTVAALTTATMKAAVPGVSSTRSGRSLSRSRWSSQNSTGRPSMASAHSDHASPAAHPRAPGDRPPGVILMVVRMHALWLRSPSQASSVTCKCGQPASRDRYGRRVPGMLGATFSVIGSLHPEGAKRRLRMMSQSNWRGCARPRRFTPSGLRPALAREG
jgi:hypothetical protein